MSLDEYRDTVRKWFTGVDVPDVPDDEDQAFEVLRGWQRTLYDAGWLGISWPREVGGQGLTPMHQLVFAQELARAGAPQPIGIIGLEVVGGTLATYGTPSQRALIPMLLSGEDIWCQGFSEPGAGSDLASLRSRAVVEGDEFVVNGQKIWTSHAHRAKWCALLARTDPDAPEHRGISYILVGMASPGVTWRRIKQMNGNQEFCEVFFDDVRVPITNLVGELNNGWLLAMDSLAHERGAVALRNCALYEVAVNRAIEALRQHYRKAGTTPSDRVCEQIGRCVAAVRSLEAQTRRTAVRIGDGDVPSPYDSVDKMAVTAAEQLIYGAIDDLLGAYRVVEGRTGFGLDSSAWVRDYYFSRAASIYGGSAQVQQNIIAERLLGLPRG